VLDRTLRARGPQSSRPPILGLIAAFLLTLTACDSPAQHLVSGIAFAQDATIVTGDKPIRPGTEIGLLEVYLHNVTASTITIDSVSLKGPGIGTVIRPVKIEMAPLRFGASKYERNAAPEALYNTDPPVFFFQDRCNRQALFRLKGFKMTPGSEARVWIVLRAIRPGKWVIPRHVIYYTADGIKYRQAMPLHEYGSVSRHAVYIPPYFAMAECVGPATGAKFLPGFHAGRTSG
jgi:hypothetical protein